MKVITNDENYTKIADAIREKTGKQDKFLPNQMAEEIKNIKSDIEPEPPDDGKTRFYITLYTNLRADYKLNINQSIANGAIIDWGDGSPTETKEEIGYITFNHKYENAGDYIISIENIGTNELRLGKNSQTETIFGEVYNENEIYANSLKKMIIGSDVSTLTNYCFSGYSSLGKVEIKNGVSSFASGCFSNNGSLTIVTIPESVSSIYYQSFVYCRALKEVHIKRDVPPYVSNSNIFLGTPTDMIIFVPVGTLEAYKTATNWSKYADQMVEEEL